MAFSGHSPRKRFGQHWLKDECVLRQIVEAADLREDDRVLEIGPGRGALTERLLKSKVSSVHAIELDMDLIGGLRKRFAEDPRFTLQLGDVLQTSLSTPAGMPANKVVANIPYNITAPLLARLVGRLGFSPETSYQRLVLLLQKEVAERILARPGQSSFSAMSVRIQLLAKSTGICDVSPKSFKPSTKVYSKVIAIDPLPFAERQGMKLEKQVEVLLKAAFLGRRKKLRNTLGNIKPLNDLEVITKALGISLDQRPQELSPITWVALARAMEQMDKIRY